VRRSRVVVGLSTLCLLAVSTAAAAAEPHARVGSLGATPALSAHEPSGPARLTGSASPALPRGAEPLGQLAPHTSVHLVVTLRIPHPASLATYIADLSDRQSPLFHHFLQPALFGAMFGPSASQVNVVQSALRARGLSPGPLAADRLSFDVTATAGTVERAFDVSLHTYQLPDGRKVFANAQGPLLPLAARSLVQGVLGLNDVYRPRSMIAHPRVVRSHALPAVGGHRLHRSDTAGPQPCAQAQDAANSFGSETANELASYYAIPGLYKLGDLGQGVHIALAEFEPNSPSDIATYKSCYGLNTPVTYYTVDGGPGTGAGSGEAALDIEDVAGLAPKASIDVYQEPNGSAQDTYDLYSAIINSDIDQVVSTSWGVCELDADPSLLSSEYDLFEEANTQAQTVFAATGDSGSTDCMGDGTTNSYTPAVNDPASQPYVVGVGGTSIGSSSENVWNDSDIQGGAGGGGISVYWCMPSYQDQTAIPGLDNDYSQSDPTDCGSTSTDALLRQVPDVAADADPDTGYVIYFEGSWQGGWGGTSAAAPLWAAVAALTDSSPFCADYGSNSGGDAGVLPQGLYDVAASSLYPYALYDVTNGDNDYTPSGYTGGLYPATTGYDMASGLGTPWVGGLTNSGASSNFYPGLAASMCWVYRTKLDTTHVTSISPRYGPATHTTAVTVTGSGFLPITGADMAKIGSKWVPAACPSTTKCTVHVPQGAPGVHAIQISAEDLTLSPAVAAADYRAFARPTVTKLTPNSGPANGRETVTIHGRNFSHVTSVRFGSKDGKDVRVISSTEIIVRAPSGRGTVHVIVRAAGGISSTARSSTFRY
jgi:subtilase family serine protease